MPNSSKGFTLIELVMVIIILGILAATAIPKFAGQSAYDERFFYEDVLAGLRHAQKLAMSTGCSVEFNQTASGFELMHNTNCFSGGAADYSTDVFRPGDTFGYVVGNSSAVWTSDENPLIFTAEGQVSNAGGATQNSTTLTTGGWIITIDGQTGYIR